MMNGDGGGDVSGPIPPNRATEPVPLGSSADEVQVGIPTMADAAPSAVPVIDDDPSVGGVEFVDHFSLRVPSSTLRFRGGGGGGGGGGSGGKSSCVYLYEQRSRQIQLLTSTSTTTGTSSSSSRRKDGETRSGGIGDDGHEPDWGTNNREASTSTSPHTRIVVKAANTGSTGLNALRATYTIMAVFMTGFLLIFSLQIIIYIFLDLIAKSGYATNPAGTRGAWSFLGTLMSIPVFVYGLATAMTLAGTFVADAWGRHTLLQSIGPFDLGQAATEWTCFTVFLGIPTLTICITLLIHLDDWLEKSLLVWFGCVTSFYLVFVLFVHGYEIRACLHLVRALDFPHPPDGGGEKRPDVPVRAVLWNAIRRRQRHTLCGTRDEMYLVRGDLADPNLSTAVAIHGTRRPHRVKVGLYARCSRWLASGCGSPCHSLRWSGGRAAVAMSSGDGNGCDPESTGDGDGRAGDGDGGSSGDDDGDGRGGGGCCGGFGALFFRPLTPPVRNYTMEDVLEVTPFVTSNTWSLEKVYCSTDRNTRVMTVVRGPSALHDDQLKSSVACAVMGNVLGLLLVISLLIWFSMGVALILIVAVIMLACFVPEQRRTWSIYAMYRDALGLGKLGKNVGVASGLGPKVNEGAREDDEEESALAKGEGEDDNDNDKNEEVCEEEGIYQLWETYRITEPTECVCVMCFALTVIFLFIIPLIHLFLLGNVATAILFLFIGLFSGTRFYLNAAVIVREVGSMDLFEDHEYSRQNNRHHRTGSGRRLRRIDERTGGERRRAKKRSSEGRDVRDDNDDDDPWVWRDKSRLSQIMGMITRGRGRTAWTWFFLFFFVAFFVLSIAAVGTQSIEGYALKPEEAGLALGFYYPSLEGLPYPTCRMKKKFSLPNGTDSDLADYAFLANLAYVNTSVTQYYLDEWFGEGNAVDHPDLVEAFRSSIPDGPAPVSYKLVTFADVPGLGVVTIRGTQNALDWFANAQIWAGAFLAQILRFFLPMGDIFTPILDEVVNVASVIGRHSLARVSYYRETTGFVEFLQDRSDVTGLTDLQVTGHSLGGGLAIITGAQTGVPAVAISGVNAMISRKTLLPPVSAHDLNTRVFNVVPDRDPVAHVDDVADLFQRIQCRSPANDPVGCHSGLRSLCDLLYHCGTGARPALCQCSRLYGYPDPLAKNGTTLSFDEVCPP